MPVTEQFQAWGSWSITLKGLPDDTTPESVWSALDPDTNAFGHILITAQKVDPVALGDAGMLSISKYTGIYRGGGSRNEISGIGMVGWLADEDGKGEIWEATQTGVDPTASATTGSFIAWIRDVLPSAVEEGTLNAIAGTMTDKLRLMTPLAMLDVIMDYFGGVFRVNPDGTLDAGTEADLFATTPEVLLTYKGSGPDADVQGIRGNVDLARDAEDWTSRVILTADKKRLGTANIGSNPYKDIHGNAASRKRIVDAPNIAGGNANTIAAAQLARFDDIRKAYSLSSDEWGIRVRGKQPEPGDYIYVYDPRPDAKLQDTDNQVYFQGELVFPVEMRLEAITWPIEEGMGVYFRDGAGNYTDLTEHVEYEGPGTTLDVGAAPRTLTGGSTSAEIQARLNSPSLIGFAEATSNVGPTSAGAHLTVLTVDVDVVAGRRYEIRVSGGFQINTSGDRFQGHIRVDSVSLTRWGDHTATIATHNEQHSGFVIYEPAADDTVTVEATLVRSSGTGVAVFGASSINKGTLLVYDVGVA